MKKEHNLGTHSIPKLLITFSIPCIISMLINAVYNMVDQIFIGQGVGYLGNAATNVIFPLILVFTALAQLLGNGCASFFSLKLGQGKKEEAKKGVGSAITLLFFASFIIGIIAYLLLPQLLRIFGCTPTVEPYAMEYGKIIIIGAPFMMIYTGLSAIIRADGSPKYSMISIVIGAILNIILDPIFIFGFKLGVAGGAYATIIGQILSCIITIAYLFHMKNIRLKKQDLKLDKSVGSIVGYGMSSFITQITVLVIFVVMNNLMTKYGANSEFGSDIPLSAFGIVSKLNQIFISIIIGLSIGAQPIIGYNYGANNPSRVKETIRRVIQIGFGIGLVCSLLFVLFPSQLVQIFGSGDDQLYLKFATDCCRIYLLTSCINAISMSSGILIQSIGKVGKATFISVLRQILLFVPIAIIMSMQMGLYGSLYAEIIADGIAFVISATLLYYEYKKIGKETIENKKIIHEIADTVELPCIITINREYGSGGRYVGRLLADALQIPFYDHELITLTAQKTGLSENFIEQNEESHSHLSNINFDYNITDDIFINESKTILELAQQGPCVIVGRCANMILKDTPRVLKVFLYNTDAQKEKRVTTYYGVDSNQASKIIQKINKQRKEYYHHYTHQTWNDLKNYDLCINADQVGIENTVTLLQSIVKK